MTGQDRTALVYDSTTTEEFEKSPMSLRPVASVFAGFVNKTTCHGIPHVSMAGGKGILKNFY